MSTDCKQKISADISKEQKDFLQLIIHEDAATSLSGAVQWCIDACMRIEKLYGVDACYVSFNDVRKEWHNVPDTSQPTPSTNNQREGEKVLRWVNERIAYLMEAERDALNNIDTVPVGSPERRTSWDFIKELGYRKNELQDLKRRIEEKDAPAAQTTETSDIKE